MLLQLRQLVYVIKNSNYVQWVQINLAQYPLFIREIPYLTDIKKLISAISNPYIKLTLEIWGI